MNILFHNDKPYKDEDIVFLMKSIFVSDIMTQDPISVDPKDSLLDCAKKMVNKKVGSVLLGKNKRLIGIITEKDILWAMIKKPRGELSKIRAIDISPRKIATIKPLATVEEAVKKMNRLKFDRLPVIHNGELVGMITAKDILTFKPEFYPEIEEYAQIMEEEEKIRRIKQSKEGTAITEGICEECGSKDFLYRKNGMLICEACKNSL